MQWLVEVGLSNALAASVLAMVACCVGRLWRRPAVTHALWLLVLLKLLTPPILELPLPWTIPRAIAFDPETAILREVSRADPPAQRHESTLATPQAISFETGSTVVPPPRNNPASRGAAERQTSAAELPAAGFIAKATSGSDQPAIGPSQRSAPIRETILLIDPPPTMAWLAWRRLAATAWLIGLLAWAALQIVLGLRLRAVVRASTPAPPQLHEAAADIARRMGLRSFPRIRIVAGTGSPMLCGLGARTTVLMPAALLRRLSAEAQTTVLAHELAHYWRGDQWVRLLELVVTGLYWWHPAVWWARQHLEISEEQCCDAHVLAICAGKTRVYAEALLDIVDLISEPARKIRPAMSSGIGHRPVLQKRLVDLMSRRCVPTMTPRVRRAVIVAGALCLFYHPTLFVSEAHTVRAASFGGAELIRSRVRAFNEQVESPPVHATSTQPPTPIQPARELPPPPQLDQVEWATAISPNGRYHLTVSHGYQCELREVTARQVRSLSGHRIACVAFTQDSARFVTGDLQGTVRLWDAASGEVLQTLAQQGGAIHTLCLAPDGNRAVVAGEEGIVELVSLADPGDRQVLARLDVPIRCARFSPDGSQLGIVTDTWKASRAATVAVYDTVSGDCRLQWELTEPIGAIAFRSSNQLLTIEWSGRVRQWSLPALESSDLPAIAKELVSAAAFSTDTRVLEDLVFRPADHAWRIRINDERSTMNDE
jgi:beta-lactamase regulating signal transducer with metallopeptidase domain